MLRPLGIEVVWEKEIHWGHPSHLYRSLFTLSIISPIYLCIWKSLLSLSHLSTTNTITMCVFGNLLLLFPTMHFETSSYLLFYQWYIWRRPLSFSLIMHLNSLIYPTPLIMHLKTFSSLSLSLSSMYLNSYISPHAFKNLFSTLCLLSMYLNSSLSLCI